MEAYITHNDLQLLRALRELKSEKAFDELYHRHFEEIFRYVYKIVQDKNTAEDLVQNVLWTSGKGGRLSVFTVENHIKKALYQIRQSLLIFILMMLIQG